MHPDEPHAEIIRHMEAHRGPVHENAFLEIVRGDPSVAVHVIPATDERPWMTLFTAGMSDRPMAVPGGYEHYRYAELMIHLPPDWPITAVHDPDHFWPVRMLRRVAYLPHLHETWLGPPPTILADGDPPQPFAPNTAFTCMLLMPESGAAGRLEARDGRVIQFYWLLPLYTDERDLELEKGVAHLFDLLDEFEVPAVVDIHRASVARPR